MTPRKPNSPLTEAQLEIMNLVWDHGECTISTIWESLREHRDVARNTVLTLVNRLEERGWLSRRASGRSFLYRSRISRDRAERDRLRGLLDGLFGGSAEHMVRSLIGHELIDAEEMARVKRLLAQEERKRRDGEKTP